MPLFNNFPYTNFHEMNLDWVLKKVKLIDSINTQISDLTSRYNTMFNKVTDLSRMYDTFAEEIRADLDEYEADIDDYIATVLNQFQLSINNQFEQQNTRLDQLNTRLNNIEQTMTTSAYMESPFTGEIVPVQQVIYQLASLHTTDALTAGEYDAAELTAAAYDALNLTAYAYDWHGKTYIN